MDTFNVTDIQSTLRIVVKALDKAIGSDTREYLNNCDMDTNNALILLRGDYINTNLRNMFSSSEDVELKHFKRFVWIGQLLIDRKHKIVITISSRSTLQRVKKINNRKNPYYVQSMCHVLNGDLEAPCKQMSFADMEGIEAEPLFSDADYELDFESIVDAAISQNEGYRHFLIVYEAERFEIKSVSVMMLDKDLDTVQEVSLMDLLEPDFGKLTAPVVKNEEEPLKKDAHSLINVKKDLKSWKSYEPERQTEITTKREEDVKQA